MTRKRAFVNHLKGTGNPYLKQHENNPVDWYPWGEEAFTRAKELDRPIFLSIGYSTCHWCHVMAHESFEDEEVAGAMNRTFVSVKVDREERPDIDAAYMKAAHMATGRGGWPLTVMMTPDKDPFFFKTYVPKNSRSGMIGMLELCETVNRIWRENRPELMRSALDVRKMLERTRTSGGAEPGEDLIKDALKEFASAYDKVNGGFGDHPKFPSPHQLIFLLRHWWSTGESRSLDMALHTFMAMRQGGLFDHVGSGFHRYSTDREWKLPHFEKMLYDQAMMVLAYAEAYQATRDPLFRDTVERTVDYMVRDLREDDDMFRSSEDADSEGEEGLFYLWTTDEVRKVLGKDRAKSFIKAFSMEPEGNYRDEATRRRTGSNILHFRGDGDLTGFGPDLARLEAVRRHRVRPQRDEKVLLDWNALTVSALSRAGKVMGRDDHISQARRTMDALLSKMRSADGGLFHSMINGQPSVKGFLDDHAFMLLALLDLYEACFDPKYLRSAMEVAKAMSDGFLDEVDGGFFQTSHEHEPLLIREKEAYDGAMPSGNSAAALGLLRLARMTGDHGWEEMAWRTMKTFSGQLRRAPSAHTYMSCALMHSLGPSREIVVVGDKEGKDTNALLDIINSTYIPNKTVLFRASRGEGTHLSELAPFTDDAVMIGGRATVYVCKGGTCEVPITDPEALKHVLVKPGLLP